MGRGGEGPSAPENADRSAPQGRLRSPRGLGYTYDSNGNLTTKTEGSDAWTYSWNAENQLTKVEKNGAEVARFSYDPKGRRVEKVAGAVTTSYTYDGPTVLREVRGGAALRYLHGPGIDEALAFDDGSSLFYLHADALGSIIKTTNGAGVVSAVRAYDSWGNLQEGADQPGPAFTGREWDPETGLYYYRARYYDAKLGRFISEDPIGVLGGLNFYSYVRNRVVNLVDPLGLLEMQHCSGYRGSAGLCCKGGRFVMCTDFTWFYAQPEGTRRCLTDHEEYHVWQMQWDPKPKCGECTGDDPCTTLSHRPGTGQKRECAARFRTYLCLQNTTPTHRLVRILSDYLDEWCFNRPGFGMM